MLVAATPAWFADNAGQITAAALVVVALLVVRFVQKTAVRLTVLGILAAFALLVYINRAPLEECARTCECSIADRDINVPGCEPEADLGRR